MCNTCSSGVDVCISVFDVAVVATTMLTQSQAAAVMYMVPRVYKKGKRVSYYILARTNALWRVLRSMWLARLGLM